MTLDELKERIIPILVRYGVKKAGLFGSIVKGTATQESDIDVLVEIGRKDLSLLDFVGIKLELEHAIGRKVDLVEYSAIKSLLRERILAEEVSIL